MFFNNRLLEILNQEENNNDNKNKYQIKLKIFLELWLFFEPQILNLKLTDNFFLLFYEPFHKNKILELITNTEYENKIELVNFIMFFNVCWKNHYEDILIIESFYNSFDLFSEKKISEIELINFIPQFWYSIFMFSLNKENIKKNYLIELKNSRYFNDKKILNLNAFIRFYAVFQILQTVINEWIINYNIIDSSTLNYSNWIKIPLNKSIVLLDNKILIILNKLIFSIEKIMIKNYNFKTLNFFWKTIFKKNLHLNEDFFRVIINYYQIFINSKCLRFFILLNKTKKCPIVYNSAIDNINFECLNIDVKNGWFLVFNPEFVQHFENFFFVIREVNLKPNQYYFLSNSKNLVNNDLIDNSMYKTKIKSKLKFWKTNKLLINWKKNFLEECPKTTNFFNKSIGYDNTILKNLNYLNAVSFKLNLEFLNINENLHNSTDVDTTCDFDVNIASKRCFETIKKDFLLNTEDNLNFKEIIINENFFQKNQLSIENNKNYKILQKFLINSLLFFHTNLLKNKIFYFSYQLDNRIRSYVYNWPINYQLEHFIRNGVLFHFEKSFTISKIYFLYCKLFSFKDLNTNFNLKIFHYQKLNDQNKTLLLEFVEIWLKKQKKHYDKIKLPNKFIPYITTKIEFSLILYIEAWCDIFYRLGKNEMKDNMWNDSIFKGYELFFNFITIDVNNKEVIKKWAKFLKIKANKYTELINFYLLCKNFYVNEAAATEYVWFNDASSNAVQLQTIILKCNNEKMLKLTNIWNNDTVYKDIYVFICNEIISKLKTSLLKNFIFIIDRSLIKNITMPSCYGLQDFSIEERIIMTISDNSEKLKFWLNLTQAEKTNFKKFISANIWSILAYHNFFLKDYLKLLQLYALLNYNNCFWYNTFNFPINIYFFKQNKRTKQLSKRIKMKGDLKKLEYVFDDLINKDENLLIKEKFELHINEINNLKIIYKNKIKEVKENYINFTKKLKEKIKKIKLEKKKLKIINKFDCFEKKDVKFDLKIENLLLIENKQKIKLKKILTNLKKKLKNDNKKIKNSYSLFVNNFKNKKIEDVLKKKNDVLSKLEKLDLKLEKENLKNTYRKVLNFYLNNKFISYKVRYSTNSKIIDKTRLINGIAPNITHSIDAQILMLCVLKARADNIPLAIIHDSIGSSLFLSLYFKLTFKISVLDWIEIDNKNKNFPFNMLNNYYDNLKNFKTLNKKEQQFLKDYNNFNKNYERNKKLFNFTKFKLELLESKNFFN